MAMPLPGDAARGLLSFRLFGVPVSIHASFLLISFAFGWTGSVDRALVWMVVVTISVLAHELGHALVAIGARGEPRIDLFAIAGLTRWNAAHAGRGRRIAVSLAGVGAGVLFGAVLWVVRDAVDPAPLSLLEDALDAAVYANLSWGLLNLLPMLPLDGGQVVRALMPGRDELSRDARTAVFSLGVAVAVGVAAFVWVHPIAAAFVLFFAVGNVQTLLAVRRLRGGGPVSRDAVERADLALHENRPDEALALLAHLDHPVAKVLTATALLRLGNAREAQHLLLDLPDEVRLDPTFEAAVLLANGQERLARERLGVSLREDPPAWAMRELATVLRRRGADLDVVLADVRGQGAVGVANALFHDGAYAQSAQWGERALGSGVDDPFVAFNVACAWARAGDPDRALRALDHAILLGFADARLADTDEDLATLRAHPGWAAVRGRLGDAEAPH